MILAFFLLPLLSFAHVIQDDVSAVEKTPFSFATVCQKMVPHESPLIEIVSSNTIDCMGTKIGVAEFCDKAMAADPYYIRAWVDKDKKQVVCQSGKKVIFKFLCVKLSDKDICLDGAQSSCLNLKKKIANRLDLVHSSYVKNDKGIKQLNCFYESLTVL